MSVYFVQPPAGGPIKMGASGDVAARMSTLSGSSPTGLSLIAQMPGHRYRETLLRSLLREDHLHAEWLRPSPPVWRMLLEVIDHGDLRWLPQPMLSDLPRASEYLAAAASEFGGMGEVARIARTSVANLRMTNLGATRAVSHATWGAIEAVRMLSRGDVPEYLAARRSTPASEAA